MSIGKKQDQEAGVALILAIFGLLLLSAIALAMLFSSNTETSISVNYRDKQSAIYGALAGLQEARDRIHPLTGDLGAGTNLSTGGLNIVPTALPSTSAPNVLYLINPASGETVAPWNPSNQYFDTELCHESYFVNNLGVTAMAAGTPCPATSASAPSGNSWYAWYDNSQKKTNTSATGTGDAATLETAYQLQDSNGNKIPLTYKWVRISLKADNMTPISVGTGNGSQVCWSGSHEEQLSTGYTSACTPITGGITNIAVTASGSGYTSTPNVTISGGSGSGATASAVVGQLPVGLTSVTLTSGGAGYTTVPAVTITPADGNGSGGVVNAALNNTLPVTSVGPTGASWASPSACYPVGSAPTVSFSPAGATATATMTGNTCIYGFAASGTCGTKNETDTVTATNGAGSGFTGSVTTGSNKKVSGSFVPTNPGNYTTVPTTFSASGSCSGDLTITPTYGIQINAVNVTAGGAYTSGSPPSVTLGGATPVGGAPAATATLSASVNPGPVTSLSIPFGENGSGYDANPVVSIAAPSCTPGPGCVPATGTASIATDYGVLGINITNPGAGYSQGTPPTVTLSGGGSGSGATASASVGSAGNTMGGVYLLTALAVTSSGSRAMTQMEIGVTYNSFTFGIGGALTLIGPNPSFGTPHSQPFQMIGTDCPTCAPVPSGCSTSAVPARDAIGIDDPTNATSPSAVQTVISDLAKPNNYIGANSSPDVVNASLGTLSASELNEFVGQVASAATDVYGTPTATVSNPSINLGTAANPAIDVVNGNYSMGPTTGYGILVVTGTLTFSGNYSWNGLILVIGSGASIMNGGGNGQIVGAVYVANTSGNSFGSPNANWNGGGGNGIQYDHCWADYMISKIPPLTPAVNASALQVISLRTETY